MRKPIPPEGATHYCTPFYYRVKNRKVYVYRGAGWVISLHSVSSLNAEPDLKRCRGQKSQNGGVEAMTTEYKCTALTAEGQSLELLTCGAVLASQAVADFRHYVESEGHEWETLEMLSLERLKIFE